MDKSPVVASAVLVSAMHLLAGNAEIIKRWTNEIQEAVQSKSAMVAPCPALTDIEQTQRHTVRLAAATSLRRPSELSAHIHLHAARHDRPRARFAGRTATPSSSLRCTCAEVVIHLQVQFHAVALLHALRAGDRLAVSKLVASLTKGSGMGASSVRSPLAQCLLVRYVAQVCPAPNLANLGPSSHLVQARPCLAVSGLLSAWLVFVWGPSACFVRKPKMCPAVSAWPPMQGYTCS